MINPFEQLLKHEGIVYQIKRNNVIIGNTEGLIDLSNDNNNRYIQIPVNSNVSINDTLINPAGKEYLIKNVETDYFIKKQICIKAYYLDNNEIEHQKNQSPVFNINNAYGSVIGTQSYVTLNYNENIEQLKYQINASNSPDKEQLNEIIEMLQKLINNHEPIKKGMFSKFSDVMERNSWISSSIFSTLLNLLFQQ